MKTYWQTIDSFGKLETYTENKPKAYTDNQGRTRFDATSSKYLGDFHLFPMVLKPLQIAEITVCENGTWSYEIEREEGWYMCFDTDKISPIVLQWTGGIFKAANGASFTEDWFKCNGWICEDKIESQLLNEIRK